jgi:hypothetical protein
MAVTPNSIITPQGLQTANAVVTAAKTSYADATNAVLLLTAGANGSIVCGLTAVPRGALSAVTKLMLFRSPDGGTTLHYIRPVLVAAYASDAATTAPAVADWGFSETVPLRLSSTDQLYVGAFAAAANGIVVDCQYENL